MNIKVSIIITCYNLGEYLQEAVDSIKDYSQIEDIEIIIVNDGSTDTRTNQIIESIAQNDSTIVLLNQDNLGLAKARNNGIKQARGAYIIPLDADNKIRPIFITKSIELLNNESIHVVHGNAQFFGNKSAVWVTKPFIISEMVLNNYIDACAAFRKSDWELIGGYDENMPEMGFEDWDLWLRMSMKGFRFQYVNEILFDYRVREHSMISDAWKKRELLLDYIFSKNELIHLSALRNCLIENHELKMELSVKQLFNLLLLKVKKKLI